MWWPISSWSKRGRGHKFRKDFIWEGIDKDGYKFLKKYLTTDEDTTEGEKEIYLMPLVKVLLKRTGKKGNYGIQFRYCWS